MNRLSREIEDKLAEIRQAPPGTTALRLLSELREQYHWEISDYRNALKLIRTSLYENQDHFILELVQNADDAQFSNGKDAELKFAIKEKSIELLYNEEGFDVNDVIAITGVGASTKIQRKTSAHSFIGEKGIGFKSVFALASSIEIESPPWHFILDRKDERFIIPIPVENGKLRKGDGTRLVINFVSEHDVENIANSLRDIVQPAKVQTILFLQRLAKFYIEDHRETPTRIQGVMVSPGNRLGESLTVNFENSDDCYEYVLYHEEMEFPESLVKERWENLVCEGPLKRKMVAAASVSEMAPHFSYHFNRNITSGRLFCFLPTKITLPIPIFLQIDGRTKADRERLYEPTTGWNKHLLDRLPGFLTNAIESWKRNPKTSEKLPNFIPNRDMDADQLSVVFSQFFRRLKNTAWIRTFENETVEWVSPEDALISSEFWTKWFVEDSSFRVRVENRLKRKFVNPVWIRNGRWVDKLEEYGVSALSEEQVASIILQDVELPTSLLFDDTNLVKLYTYLSNWSSENRDKFQSELRKAPIFPFEGGKREALDGEDGVENVYWLSVESKRSTGLENIYEYRVIDGEYTYRVKDTNSLDFEIKKSNAAKKTRNNVTRNFLRQLNVEELNEDKILQLQVQWLINNPWTKGVDDETPMNILLAIYEAYSAKQNREDKQYLDNLSKLSTAKMPSEKGNLFPIQDMTLPISLNFEESDQLFLSSDMESLHFPMDRILPQKSPATNYSNEQEEERQEKHKRILREFLIACGICNRLRFVWKDEEYDDMDSFSSKNPEKCRLLKWEIGNNYTRWNPIKISTVEIADSCKRLFIIENNKDLLSRLLYDSWRENSGQFSHDRNPNGFLATYLRRSQQLKPICDGKWAGIEKSLIPLCNINQDITNVTKAIRILEMDLKSISFSRSFFPFVLETKDSSKGYDTEYLDSLQVTNLKIRHLNSLWDRDDIEKDNILKIALEFANICMDISQFKVFDQNLNRLRQISDWVIAGSVKVDSNMTPAIDLQYGKAGYELGIKLKLEQLKVKEKEKKGIIYDNAHSLKNAFSDIYKNCGNDLYALKLKDMLLKWKYGDKELRRVISYNSQHALSSVLERPIVILNDFEMASYLKEENHPFFELGIDDKDRFCFVDAARDLGLSLPDDVCRIELTGKRLLNSQEQREFSNLLDAYIGCLDDKYQYKLDVKCIALGSPQTWVDRIILAESATIVLATHFIKTIDLPRFDDEKFIVQSNEAPENILAHILDYFDFARFKNAILEISEMKSKNDVNSEVKVDNIDRDHLRIVDIESIKDIHRNSLQDKRETPQGMNERGEWKTGLSPEEEEKSRMIIGEKFVESLKRGPEFYNKKLRKSTNQKEQEKQGLFDSDATDPKAFLLAEYNGQCQICGIELLLSSGNKWIETFRIVEEQTNNWWANRPFNVLGLCPNCHALAKHGGSRDFSSLEREARDLLNGNAWAREVPLYNGDFYVIKVRINGKERNMVVSKMHLNHFAALYAE